MSSDHNPPFHLFSVTEKGDQLSELLEGIITLNLSVNVRRYPSTLVRQETLSKLVATVFTDRDKDASGSALIFVCATGIAVRMIAPFIKDKLKDPACLVIDDHGKFVISLLSGHVGKANYYTNFIATLLNPHYGSLPVVTTASDIRGIEGFESVMSHYRVDLERHRSVIKQMNAALVSGKSIGILADPLLGEVFKTTFRVKGDAIRLYQEECALLQHEGPKVVITLRSPELWLENIYETVLFSRSLILGTGCRKALETTSYEKELESVLSESGFDIRAIAKIASIDLKQDETCLLEISRKYNIPFITQSSEALRHFADAFDGSDFVEKTTGVRAVAGPSAFSLTGDKLTHKIYKREKCTFSLGRIPL